MSDLSVTLHSIRLHPVKSCGGFAVDACDVAESGLDLDREWVVVDADGVFVSQRQLPRMALVQASLKLGELVLRAPGMLALHVAIDRVESRTTVQVWNDRIEAYDMGPLCAQWLSDALGRRLRLARFDPEVPRLADRRWVGETPVAYAFQDAFPLLVTSTASLDEVNRRLAANGSSAVAIDRFRPNLIIDSVDAHGEDHLDEIAWSTPEGPVRIRLVKPCVRCAIADVDPRTGVTGHDVGDVLTAYRSDPRMGGAITFAMNAIVVEGIGRTLTTGLLGEATYRFD